MKTKKLKIVLVSTPIGTLGSGKGGGVELTLISLIKGLLHLGHELILVAPSGSVLPSDCKDVDLRVVDGVDQLSWQKQDFYSPVILPANGVLPKLLKEALDIGKQADAVLNMSYDWLPLWLTPFVEAKLFHLISMGGVSKVVIDAVKELSQYDHSRLAFHTNSQASDYELYGEPIIVGNGFDLSNYHFQPEVGGPIGWAGRIAPEKGLEDAASVAAELGETLLVWGLIEDKNYAKEVESLFPKGTINWKGFLETRNFQKELGKCRVLINTPKWNEAFGNVIVESLACGVPVVAYERGGPGELIKQGITGWLVPKDDVSALTNAVLRINEIDRKQCRLWVEETSSYKGFAERINDWINGGIHKKSINNEYI